MPSRSQILKIALIGDTSTGKTALIQRYLTGRFMEDPRATLGVNFCTKTLEMGEGMITLQIWDFGGNERFHFLVSSYCQNIDAILFVYDITNSASLHRLEKWLHEFRANGMKEIFLVVGTKCDLNSNRQLQAVEVAAYAQSQGTLGTIEVSSKTGENVNLAFEIIIKRLLNHPQEGKTHLLQLNEPH